MKNILKIFILFVLVHLNSCQRYLDTIPDSSFDIHINTEEKIAELLTGAYPKASYFSFLEARTDNVAERVNGEQSRLNEAMFFWEDYDQEDLDTPLNYWNSCYIGIAQANKALELLEKYPKTARVKALYGEAFLLRAYLHFMLVNIWSEPYGIGKSAMNPGIPYLEKPEKNALVDYDRGTVKEVYEKIERDLKLGITLVDDSYYKKPAFHFNKKAAYAFASRFYLMKGDWDLVIRYADYVLGADPKLVLRNWKKYENEFKFNRRALYTKYTDAKDPANLLLTTTESRIARNLPTEKYGTTYPLLEAIYNNKGIEGCPDAKKLNWLGFYIFTFPDRFSDVGYLSKFDESSLFESTGIRPRDLYVTNALFTMDEVLLNRMEAYAMLNQYERAIDDILDYIKGKFGDLAVPPCYRELYTTINASHYEIFTPFYGLTIKQLALIKLITDFRQKEFIHEGLRWFDIRRFYMPVTRSTKSSLYRKLRKEDHRKQLQIPVEAISRGLQPNPR